LGNGEYFNNLAVVILAGGSSSRMGGVKKEFLKFDNGDTVLGCSVRVFAEIPSVKIIVIVVPQGEPQSAPQDAETTARQALPSGSASKKILFVTGGDSRRISVFNALRFLEPYNPCYVLIHDGARPWITASLAENVIASVKKYDAVIPLLPITDTPKEISKDQITDNKETAFITKHLKRSNVGFAQTPQAFKFPEILQAHEKAAQVNDEEFTDDAEIWGRFIGQVAVIPGEIENKKITFPEDIV